jgi:hypothetical protein
MCKFYALEASDWYEAEVLVWSLHWKLKRKILITFLLYGYVCKSFRIEASLCFRLHCWFIRSQSNNLSTWLWVLSFFFFFGLCFGHWCMFLFH